MYRALYDFADKRSDCLSFTTGDKFTILDSSRSDWYFAQNGFGQIGYIPSNYIVEDNPAQIEVLKSIERAIEAIHFEATSAGGAYTKRQRENLQKLIEHRRNVMEGKTGHTPHVTSSSGQTQRHVAPDPPTSKHDKAPDKRSSLKQKAPPPPPDRTSSLNTSYDDKLPQTESIPMPIAPDIKLDNQLHSPLLDTSKPLCLSTENGKPQTLSLQVSTENDVVLLSNIVVSNSFGSELIEGVRRNTGLSYDKSRIAVETVLGLVGCNIPEIANVMDRIFHTLTQVNSPQEADNSQDTRRLQELFSELTARKDDQQQRSWALHQDEGIILKHLEDLLSILENAKPSISRRVLMSDNYEAVHSLVQYYQMETRVSIRLVLLKVFGSLCGMDRTVISLFLYSVLPLELATELQDNSQDVQRCSFVALVLCMIFSTAEPVSVTLNDHLNKDFVRFLLENIESPPESDDEDQIPDLYVNILLAYNQHEANLDKNVLMEVLSEQGTAKTFTEKVLLILNRGDDPVCMFDHQPSPPNSVMKFITDLYKSEKTAFLLYTNDARVLIDIAMRHLVDLPGGDKVRTSYLKLIFLIIKYSDYVEHQHRHEDLQNCFLAISKKEEETAEDKEIVQNIFENNPSLFKEF